MDALRTARYELGTFREPRKRTTGQGDLTPKTDPGEGVCMVSYRPEGGITKGRDANASHTYAAKGTITLVP